MKIKEENHTRFRHKFGCTIFSIVLCVLVLLTLHDIKKSFEQFMDVGCGEETIEESVSPDKKYTAKIKYSGCYLRSTFYLIMYDTSGASKTIGISTSFESYKWAANDTLIIKYTSNLNLNEYVKEWHGAKIQYVKK